MVFVTVMIIVAVMSVFFHPHVTCCFTVCLSGVVRVLMRCCIVTIIAFVVIVVVFFHPDESACFTVLFIVDVIVGVVRHVMANAVSFFAMFVTVLVSVLVSVVVVSVAAEHLENCHGEIFSVFSIEFKDIFSFFKVEDGNHCVSRASCRVGNGFFSLNVVVAFVTIAMIVMLIFLTSMDVMTILCVIVFLTVVIVVIVVILSKRNVVCDEFSVDFYIVSVFFFVSKFNGFVRPFGKSLAQIGYEERFIVKCSLSIWHSVDLNCGRSVATK